MLPALFTAERFCTDLLQSCSGLVCRAAGVCIKRIPFGVKINGNLCSKRCIKCTLAPHGNIRVWTQDWFFGQSPATCLASYATRDIRPSLSQHSTAVDSQGWTQVAGNLPGKSCRESRAQGAWSYPNPGTQVRGSKPARHLLELEDPGCFTMTTGCVRGLYNTRQVIWAHFITYTFPKHKNFALNEISCPTFCLVCNHLSYQRSNLINGLSYLS